MILICGQVGRVPHRQQEQSRLWPEQELRIVSIVIMLYFLSVT